jgi:hypothetical protein
MGRAEFPKEIMPLVKAARAAGWTVTRTERGHIKFMPPSGSAWPMYHCGGTPSDHRALKNAKAFLRQCDVDIR